MMKNSKLTIKEFLGELYEQLQVCCEFNFDTCKGTEKEKRCKQYCEQVRQIIKDFKVDDILFCFRQLEAKGFGFIRELKFVFHEDLSGSIKNCQNKRVIAFDNLKQFKELILRFKKGGGDE